MEASAGGGIGGDGGGDVGERLFWHCGKWRRGVFGMKRVILALVIWPEVRCGKQFFC